MIFNGHSHVTGGKGIFTTHIIHNKDNFKIKEQKIHSVNRRMKYLIVGWGERMRVELRLEYTLSVAEL